MALLITVARTRACVWQSISLKFEYCVKSDTEMPQVLALDRSTNALIPHLSFIAIYNRNFTESAFPN